MSIALILIAICVAVFLINKRRKASAGGHHPPTGGGHGGGAHGHEKGLHPFIWVCITFFILFTLSLWLQPVWRGTVSNFFAHVFHSTGDALVSKEPEKPRRWTSVDVFWAFNGLTDNGEKSPWDCWSCFLRENTSTTLIFRVPTKYNDLRKAEYVRFEYQMGENESSWRNEKNQETGKWKLISRSGKDVTGRVWIGEKSYTFTFVMGNTLTAGW